MSNIMRFATPRNYNHPFFRNSFSGLFDDNFFGKDFAKHVPAVNISENEKSWNIEVSAAGFKKEDFKLKLENDVLTVSAEHKADEKKDEKNYSRREFKQMSFSREFYLKKESVNEDGINASYENGILNISIPKKEEAAKESLKEIKIS